MPAQSVHAFSEKVALITDGANPVGRAVALQLALLGSYVIVGFPENSAENKSALNELKSLGTLANAVETDIQSVEGAKILVGEVEKMFGRLDLLINTSKFLPDSSFLETSVDVWAKTVQTNLKSAFFITQAAISLMKTRPKPAIVNVAYFEENNPTFSAIQSGLIGLTKSLAKEFAPKFRINAVEIKQTGNPKDEIFDAELFRPKNGISEDDAARAIIYLLSSEAVGLNGQILTVA